MKRRDVKGTEVFSAVSNSQSVNKDLNSLNWWVFRFVYVGLICMSFRASSFVPQTSHESDSHS